MSFVSHSSPLSYRGENGSKSRAESSDAILAVRSMLPGVIHGWHFTMQLLVVAGWDLDPSFCNHLSLSPTLLLRNYRHFFLGFVGWISFSCFRIGSSLGFGTIGFVLWEWEFFWVSGLVREKSWGIYKKWRFLVQSLVFLEEKKMHSSVFSAKQGFNNFEIFFLVWLIFASWFCFAWQEFSALVLF